MNLSFDGANTKVYDDVITEEEFKNIFDFINGHPFTFRHPVGEWNKVWDLSKGRILRGNNFFWLLGETPEYRGDKTCLIPFINQVNKIIPESNLFDTDQKLIVHMTPYCYGAGAGLSWHDDRHYLGAATFYCHNHWSPEWGGEFVTVEANNYIIEDKQKIKWGVFDNSELHNLIMKNSVGNFFYPNPNRLVVNKGGSNGILHKINNTTVDSSPRLSLQCFIRLADTDE